jgi:Protein of unknown function (DUF2750)
MNDQEFENVLALPAPRRYDYSIKRIAEEEVVWTLASDAGYTLLGDDEGHELVPVWPHERLAAAYAAARSAADCPRSITLSDWLEKWIPGMQRDQRWVAIFPTPQGKGTPVTPERLKEDLEAELSLFE